MARRLLLLLLIPAAAVCGKQEPISLEPQLPDYQPTVKWRTTTPEQQGVDSRKLLEMLRLIQDEKQKPAANGRKISIDSITIVRNGYIIADMYFNPFFPPGKKHIIHSCTKSIMAVLIGIAVSRGDIKSIDEPVLNFFRDKKIENIDARKKAMTIKDLLTMQTGLDSRDSVYFKWRGLFKMMESRDWVKHALSLPMAEKPGVRFDYSNLSSFLLSAVLARATGTDTLSYAREHLFAPLGITDVRWEKSPGGIHIGWARMWLRPRDMAKLGLLLLQKGKWGDKQIVSERWVEESTRAWASPSTYRAFRNEDGSTNHKLSTGLWLYANLARPFSAGYGYQLWLDANGMYTALGHQGQYITVVPDKNMVVVVTAKLGGPGNFLPATIIKKIILPAARSSKPLPSAKASVGKKLSSLSRPPARPSRSSLAPALPSIAAAISGRTYEVESNPWKYDNFRLDFIAGRNHAILSYTKGAQARSIKVGLDDIHHETKSGRDEFVARGKWKDESTFFVEYQIIGYSSENEWSFRFEGTRLFIQETGVTGTYNYSAKARE